jgi:hypothetical protein
MMTHMRELHSWSFSAPKRASAGGKEGRKARRIHAEEKEQTREERENKGRKRKAEKKHHFQKRCVLEAQDGTNRLLPRIVIFRPLPALPPPPVSDPKSIQVLDEVLNEALDEVLREVLNEVSASGVNLCVMFRIYIVLPNLCLEYALGVHSAL